MLNCKLFRSKLFWPCLQFMHSLLSGETVEKDEKLSQSCGYPGSDSNLASLQYKSVALQIRPSTSIRIDIVFGTFVLYLYMRMCSGF
jgi:hypothetical protein